MFTRRTNWMCYGLLGLVVAVARGDQRHDCSCIITIAGELQQHGRDLGAEFRESYRSTPQYWMLQSETREIVSRAGHLQVLSTGWRGPGRNEMRSRQHLPQLSTSDSNRTCADASCGAGFLARPRRYVNVPVGMARCGVCWNVRTRRSAKSTRNWPSCTFREIGPALTRIAGFREITVPPDSVPRDFTFNNPGNRGQSGLSIANGRLTFRFSR